MSWKEKRKENELKRRPAGPECLLEYCLRMEQEEARYPNKRLFDMKYTDELLTIGRCGSNEESWEQDMSEIDWWWTIVLTGVCSRNLATKTRRNKEENK